MTTEWFKNYLALFLGIILFLRLFQAWPLYSPDTSTDESFLAVRSFLSKQINSIIPEPEATVFKGILFGIKDNLDPNVKKAFTNTSTIHIIVASGQNLTILSGFIFSLARFFGRKKVIVGVLVIDLLYCFISGLQIPILRAFAMIGFSSLAQLFNRDWDSKNILFITCAIMLIFEPNLLLSISFQLSFLATFAVMVVSPILIKSINHIPELLKEDLVITISAQLLTLPVIAANFHTISLTGILANALILWTITPIMFLGFIGVLISLFSIFLAKIILIIPFLLTAYLINIVSFLNQLILPLAFNQNSLIFWLGYYFIIGGVVLIIQKQIPKESSLIVS